jgi:hypothetical protein
MTKEATGADFKSATELETKKLFIETYVKEYNSYLDLSILSKILNNTHYEQDGYIYKLSHLFPKKTFIYSLYIKILFFITNIKSYSAFKCKMIPLFEI